MTISEQKQTQHLPRQATLSEEQRQLLRQAFRVAYEEFVSNRRVLICELQKIADKAVGVSKSCAISKLAGSSVGLGGGAAAVAGIIAFPPIVVVGGIAAGMAAVWNIGTQVVEYKLSAQKLGEETKELSEKDAKLMRELNSIHQKLFKAEMVDVEARVGGSNELAGDGVGLAGAMGRGASELICSGAEFAATAGKRAAKMAISGIELVASMEEGASGVIAVEAAGAEASVVAGAGTAELIGSAGGEVATAAGVSSVEMLGLGSQILQGVAQGAIVFGVAMDIVSIISSARILSKGSRTKFSDALKDEVKRREVELDAIRKRAITSGLVEPPQPVRLHVLERATHI